ncbi:MAG: ABC transporter ATP-binding protein [Bacteroidales bacterium]|nr:ABC transporter ATP-binding protein [Bacteroidales bacterium]
MIHVKDLKKQYNGITVLNIPELNVPEGQSFGLVGNNGAGKTTFFRLVLDLIRADKGEIQSAGTVVAGSEAWKANTGSYLDKGFLIDFLTPEEYFDFTGHIRGLSKGDIQEHLNLFSDFFAGEVIGRKKYIRDLSMGNQQKVGIASALMGKPSILVLDEPFNSLDPSTQIRLKNMLNKLKSQVKITMLISSHDLNHIAEVCDRVCILEKGKIVHDIETREDTLAVLESYFAVQ